MAHGYGPGAIFLRLKYVFRITLATFALLTSPDCRTLRLQKRLKRNAGPWRKKAKYRIRHYFAWILAHEDA